MNLKFLLEKVTSALKRAANSVNIFKDFIKKVPEEPVKVDHPTVIEETKEEVLIQDTVKTEPEIAKVIIIKESEPKEISNEAPRRIKRETKRSSPPKRRATANTRRSGSRKNQDSNLQDS